MCGDLWLIATDVACILEAPKDETKCPYRNGTFLLTCDIPLNYPRDPPEIRFVTFILHPNVSGVDSISFYPGFTSCNSPGLEARKGELLCNTKCETSESFFQVCVAELGRLWSSDITLKEIFSLIYGLLLEPDLENPLEMQASLKYCTLNTSAGIVIILGVFLISSCTSDDDDGTFALAAADAVAEHASKSREQWRLELLDEGDIVG
jgi:ubiquitin-protein ligase